MWSYRKNDFGDWVVEEGKTGVFYAVIGEETALSLRGHLNNLDDRNKILYDLLYSEKHLKGVIPC